MPTWPGGTTCEQPPTPSIRLRRDDVAGKTLLILGKEPDARPETVAEAELLFVVGAEGAAAMEIDDQWQLRGGLGTKEAIGHRPVALVRARFELFLEILCRAATVNVVPDHDHKRELELTAIRGYLLRDGDLVLVAGPGITDDSELDAA